MPRGRLLLRVGPGIRSARRAYIDESMAHRDRHGLELRVRPQFRQQALHVATAGIERDADLLRDHPRLESGREHLQDLLLALRQRWPAWCRNLRATDEAAQQVRVHGEATATRRAQGGEHVRKVAVLGQQRTGVGRRCALQQPLGDVRRQYHDTELRETLGELGGCGDSVAVAELDVHDDDVRAQLLDEAHALLDRLRVTYAQQVGLARERHRQELSEYLVVVDHDDVLHVAPRHLDAATGWIDGRAPGER